MKNITNKVLILAVFTVLTSAAFAGEPWMKIFNGKDLTGWDQKNGNAKYEVKNGAIIGTSTLNTPNSFLCSNRMYDDFILELEFKVDPRLNSGVQIRSNSTADYNNYRVHGYQVEIDPSTRAYTGGIYEEAGRGWLYNLSDNEEARNALAQSQWNLMRVEAIGDTIKTWINGVPAAHLVDDLTSCGFIGLQVHGIGNNSQQAGAQVSWRNIRIITENPAAYTKETPLPAKDMHNKLTSLETNAGWKLLFDGKTTNGWRGAKSDQFPKVGWKVENGLLTVMESGGGESEAGGDIVTTQQYSDFELKVDFLITPGANSGIKYYVDTTLNKGSGSSIGLEYQILDDLLHPDAKLGNHDGSRTVASLYDLIQAKDKEPRMMGQWNHARIFSKNNHVEHWLNGKKVLEFERGSKEFRKLVSESKYKKWSEESIERNQPQFGELPKGEILLQDHGNTVSFRNVKIREL